MEKLKEYRAKIDELDEKIISLIVERFGVVRAVGKWKAENNVPVVQSARAEEVKARAAALASAKGLDGQLLRDIYTLIIDHAHVVEDDIVDGKTE
ncbi:MAG: chorismate mutase [Alphaproteobacteria bacterium]|nr:chorismate mutase [Alphaproteobacteria bacterium]